MRSRRTLVCTAILLFIAISSLRAQTDDADASPGAPYASLSLKFDNAGVVQARLSLWSPQKSLKNSEHRLSDSLARSLHCPGTQFSRRWMPLPASWPLMSAGAQQSWLKRREKSEQNQISGTCGVLAPHGAWLNGSIELAPLTRALRQSGFTFLLLHVETPPAPSHSLAPATLHISALFNHFGYFDDAFDLSSSAPTAITIAYGVTRNDLIRALIITAAFVLLPIGFIAWIRSYALRNADINPTAAWFTYFRSLQLAIQLSTLAWVYAEFHARTALTAWASYGWQLGIASEVTINTLLLLGPLFAITFSALLLSYDVSARLRSAEWRRLEFVAVHALSLARVFVPLGLFLLGLGLMAQQPPVALLIMWASLPLGIFLRRLHGRFAHEVPQPVLAGELHDAIFELAKRANVPLKKLFVRPAGKGQLSNAFAKGKGTLIFTDHLLQKLSKREVRAIAAHELTHLQKLHPLKLALALLVAFFSPTLLRWIETFTPRAALHFVDSPEHTATIYKAMASVRSLQQWSLHDLLIVMLAFSAFYFLLHRFEFQADAGAVRLSGDPEAKITGLVKVSHLNLMPISWSKGWSIWMTHPNTLHRLERIAQLGRLPPGRVHELIESCTPESLASEDHYELPPIADQMALSDPGRLRTRLRRWSLLTMRR